MNVLLNFFEIPRPADRPLRFCLDRDQLLTAEEVAVAALNDGLLVSGRRLLNGSRIRAVNRGSRLVRTIGTIIVATSEGAAGNGQNGGGSEDDLFHFLYSSFAVRLAACPGRNSRRSDSPDVGKP